jgi:thiamine-monophosphate kinase
VTRLSEIGEFGFIDRLSRIFGTNADVLEGIGDDCAVLRSETSILLVTCDMSIEDVHFRRANTRPEDIGWKTVAISLSDIAAMGGQPRFITVSLAAPMDTNTELLERIAAGMQEAARFGGAVIVGGDMTQSREGIAIDTTAIGEAVDGRYLARHGATNGDVLAVTGFPGDAAGGLHAQENGHLSSALIERLHRPIPRVAEGRWLAQQPGVHAMIDISDGLGQDAGHIAKASKLGVNIQRDDVPIGDALRGYCVAHHLDPREVTLRGGDAYELAMAIDRNAFEATAHGFAAQFDLTLRAVGTFSDAFTGVRVDGEAAAELGFDHFRAP